MNVSVNPYRAAAIAGACLVAPLAWAAAPVGLEPEPPVPDAAAAAPAIYDLDTEMVVHNWVLCVSRAGAVELVQARQEGVQSAWSAYEALAEARKCGRFAELRVILQEPLYSWTAGSGDDARVFGALVHFADDWASAFVVTGSLPED